MEGAKYYTVFDLESGFWQVKMHKNSQEYTAFSTPDGHYKCLRFAFSLANTPILFVRLMAKVLEGLIGTICQVYLDDIVVYGGDTVKKTPAKSKASVRKVKIC
jgi:hypothetical protein